ncbi:hypothetical protein AVEN_164946-1, partial [Araneus ventricosus]
LRGAENWISNLSQYPSLHLDYVERKIGYPTFPNIHHSIWTTWSGRLDIPPIPISITPFGLLGAEDWISNLPQYPSLHLDYVERKFGYPTSPNTHHSIWTTWRGRLDILPFPISSTPFGPRGAEDWISNISQYPSLHLDYVERKIGYPTFPNTHHSILTRWSGRLDIQPFPIPITPFGLRGAKDWISTLSQYPSLHFD